MKRDEVKIGTDKNHVHFLIESIPKYSPTKIITTVKSITAKQIFAKHSEVKQQLWGGEIWTDGYFANTVSQYGNEEIITKYLRDQGKDTKDYIQLHKAEETEQLMLF